ncbi:MAG: flagellar filament capping protein FliD [Gemmatimonadaceae bacterium]
MAPDPIASFSGLSSGIQWRDMVDQIMSIESARRYNPVAARQAALRAQGDAWKAFQGLAMKVRDAARAMRDGSAFDVFTSTATKSGTSGRDLVAVSAASGAAPGTYAVEVLALARAEKLGGAVVANGTTALGVTGSFAINGRAVTVTAADTLATLRDKVNAESAASGVGATILSTATGVRLVLTAQASGATGIETVDDGAGTLAALGFTDGTVSSNVGADGAARTQRLSSATAAIATVLGIPLPTPSTIRVGGQEISIDLSVDSLTTIAARIAAATGNPDAARVRSEGTGAATRHWLETDATVEADPLDAVNSARTLAALGFTREGRGDETQVVASANAFTDNDSGLAAVGSTSLATLAANGQSLGIADGDIINIAGTRGDGSAVTISFAVTAGSTLQDLLTAIGDAGSGFGAGARAATAGLSAGRVTLTDGTSGDSALGMSLTVKRGGGGTVSLGAFSTANGSVGRDRVITAGADALARIDGQLVRRSTNTISDAIAGTTLTLLTAEAGESSQVTVARNEDAAANAMQGFAAAYNVLRTWVSANAAPGGPLAGSTALRTMAGSLTSQLLLPVVGASGNWTTAARAGLQHDRDGVLSLDATVFKAAMASDLEGVRRLFSMSGSTTDAELAFVTAGDLATPTGTGYAVVITQAATRAAVTGASWTTYSTTGAPDTMSITDASTGKSGAVAIADGDDISTVVQRLNSLFATEGMQLSAERTADDRVRIVSGEHGADGGFTVSYAPGAGGDGTALLGIAADTFTGLDVAGTIDGVAGTGRGQMLTGAVGSPVDGLTVQFRGTGARAAGSVGFSLGVGGMLARVAGSFASESLGGAASQVTSAEEQASALDSRLADIQARLEDRRTALIRQFVAMEGAIAKSQALGSALLAQLNSLSSDK